MSSAFWKFIAFLNREPMKGFLLFVSAMLYGVWAAGASFGLVESAGGVLFGFFWTGLYLSPALTAAAQTLDESQEG